MHRRLIIFFLLLLFCCNSPKRSYGAVRQQQEEDPTGANAVRREAVDSSLFKYASLAFAQLQPKTGELFKVSLPPLLSSIEAQGMTIRSASLQKTGLSLNEFSLPAGASIANSSSSSSSSSSAAAAASLLLIYRSTLNFTIYSLPAQFTFAGPIVGIVAYPFVNSTSMDASIEEITISYPNNSIRVHIPTTTSTSKKPPFLVCAFFFPNGSIAFSNVSASGNVCASSTLGDLALVTNATRSSTISPPPPPPPPAAPTQAAPPTNTSGSGSTSTSTSTRSGSWKLIVGSICLALAGLAFCVALVLVGVAVVRWVKLAIMTHFPKNQENLEISLIGSSLAPSAAGGVRTKPTLEMDMARFRD